MIGFLLSDATYDSVVNTVVQWLPSSGLKFLNENFLFTLRRRYLTRILSPHLTGSQTVLDLGASDGKLAATLQKNMAERGESISFTGCDVHLQPDPLIPVVQYDGHHLPFADNSFDCVLLVDVLHHTQDPLPVLQEAKRVSRKYILIKDHHWKSPKDFSRLSFADYIGNEPYGISLPFNFLNCQEWMDLVKGCCHLSILEFKTFRFNQLDPCKHILVRADVRNDRDQRSEPIFSV